MITGPREVVKRARKLRSEISLPETLLWRELRKRPEGLKFRRQHPAGIYVLDFFCAAARLAIEVDGFAHDSIRAAKSDESRSHYLRSQHIATLRVPASAVLKDVLTVAARVAEVTGQRIQRMSESRPVPLHHPADGPPPRAG